MRWAIFIMRLIATIFVVWRRAVFIMMRKTWRAVLVVMIWLIFLMRDLGRVVPDIWVLIVIVWLWLMVRAFRVMVGSLLRLLVWPHGW